MLTCRNTNLRLVFLLPFLAWFVVGCSAPYSNVKHYVTVGDYHTAREQLLASGPNDAQGWALLAECYYWLEDYPNFAATSKTALQVSQEYQPRIAYLLQHAYIELLNKATSAFQDGNNRDAYRFFADAMTVGDAIDADINPGLHRLEDEVLMLAGSNFLRLEDYNQARKCFERVRDVRGEDPEVLELLALCNFRLKDYDPSLIACDKLLQLQPGNANALEWRAQIVDSLQQPEEAVNAYRDALEVVSNDNRMHRNLGIILYRLGEWNLARQHLEKAYSIAPNDGSDLIELIAECLYNQAKYPEALDRFEAANKGNPDDPDILRYIAACHWKLDQREEMDSVLIQAESQNK
jgi:tetratricopeptide (TPR) repeat protein